MSNAEHEIHKALKNRIVKILKQSGFRVDSEIHVSFSNSFTDDFSLDVCAIHEDSLILIECKKSDKDLSRQIEHTLTNGPKLNTITKILQPKKCEFSLKDFKNITSIHYCYAINDTENKDDELSKKLKSKGIVFWNKDTVRYFYSTSDMLGYITKYEILREMKVKPTISSQAENAVRILQNGQELFLLGMSPSNLLRMAYAFRRTSLRDKSYQRILDRNKLDQLKEFYKTNKDFLLANSIIIAFDDDKEIQNELDWDRNGDKKLHFPTSYCCAWIIDGQHRVYAFKETKYVDPKKLESKQFKIPVVAFRKLPPHKQSRTFVNINYYQTKINTVLICDLASTFPDASYELSWVSKLVKELSRDEPWQGKIQTSQTEPKGYISIAGFVRPVLLYQLLGYSKKDEKYHGPLFKIAKFNKKKPIDKGKNKTSFDTHVGLLRKFFKSAKKNSWNSKIKSLMWDDDGYGLSRTWGVNALLLVLTAILNKEKTIPTDFNKYLTVLRNMDFSKDYIKTLSRGYGAYNELAEQIITRINKKLKTNYEVPH
jgi:DGQHR domain-containing protein